MQDTYGDPVAVELNGPRNPVETKFYVTLIQSKSVLAYCLEQIANQNTAVTRIHKDLNEMHRKNSNIGRYSGHTTETLLGYISTPNSCAPPLPPKKDLQSTSNS